MFSRISLSALLVVLLVGSAFAPANALKKLKASDISTVNEALRYGMAKQGSGYLGLLGPNWREGNDGALLNIYSPFMMLAAKVANSAYPEDPTSEDLKKARKTNGGLISHLTDTKRDPWIKYTVSFYGDTEAFTKDIKAEIVGFGRGKEYQVAPDKVNYDAIADQVGVLGEPNAFEGVNSYYFNFDDIEALENYRLVLTSNVTGKTWVFQIHNDDIY